MKIKKVSKTTQTGAQIIDGYSNSQVSGYSCNYANNNFKSKVLWTNPNPSNAFAEQTITLNSADYDYYEIYFSYSNTSSTLDYLNGFKSIKGKGMLVSENGYGTALNVRRKVDYVNDTQLKIFGGYGGSEANNNYLIPQYVIGHK